jgi:hypothetical protein
MYTVSFSKMWVPFTQNTQNHIQWFYKLQRSGLFKIMPISFLLLQDEHKAITSAHYKATPHCELQMYNI